MSVGDWVLLGVVAAAIVVGAVLVVRWASKSQAAEIAAKTEADKAAFDAARAKLLSPTPEQRVAELKPDEVTDEINKL